MTIFRFAAKLLVNDLHKAEAFYSSVMGFELLDGINEKDYLLLRAGDNYLALIPEDGASPEPPRKTGLVFMCAFPSRYVPALEEHGAKLLNREEPPWGGVQIEFVDPFGNELALYSAGG